MQSFFKYNWTVREEWYKWCEELSENTPYWSIIGMGKGNWKKPVSANFFGRGLALN
ncbi:MAG TPA: hypothetical protein VNR38_20315 [Ureibacillus sp.]|nr:hypothetical protein [Ureibacillus sp.]